MTNLHSLPEDLLKKLRVQLVRSHLASLGWIQDKDGSDENAAIYVHPVEPQAEVLVPLRRDLVDFVDRMADLVRVLSLVGLRRPFDVLNELLYPDGDFFRFKIDTTSSMVGSVPLNDGVKLYLNSRKSLLAAACSVLKKQIAYSSMRFKETDEFIDSCRLGQSEVGSYVITVINPISSMYGKNQTNPLPGFELDERFYLDHEPFSRRVTVAMMRGLYAVKVAASENSSDLIVDDIPDGVSANLCEALSSMRPDSKSSELNIGVRLSAARAWKPENLPASVSFGYHDFDVIEEAAKRLRGMFEEDPVTIEGYVSDLHADITLDEELHRTIEIQRVGKARGPIIRVKLRETDYKKAVNAHGDKKMVRVTGKLYKDNKMRTSIIKDYSKFTVID